MDNHELKALINKPINTGPLKVGDRVRIIPRAQVADPDMDPAYTSHMVRFENEIHSIAYMYGQDAIELDGDDGYTWHADWLERV